MIDEVLSMDEVEDLSATEKLVVAYVVEAGSATYAEIAEATGAGRPTVSSAASKLSDRGLVDTRPDHTTSGRGRKPLVVEPTRKLATQSAEESDLTDSEVDARIVEFLARMHYLRRVSSANSKRIGNEIGVSSHKAARHLQRLLEEGVVESFDKSDRNYWRLAGAEAVAPRHAQVRQRGEA